MELASIWAMSTNINRTLQEEPSHILLSGLWKFHLPQDSSCPVTATWRHLIPFWGLHKWNMTDWSFPCPCPAAEIGVHGNMGKLAEDEERRDCSLQPGQSVTPEEGWHSFSPTYCQFINSISAISISFSSGLLRPMVPVNTTSVNIIHNVGGRQKPGKPPPKTPAWLHLTPPVGTGQRSIWSIAKILFHLEENYWVVGEASR